MFFQLSQPLFEVASLLETLLDTAQSLTRDRMCSQVRKIKLIAVPTEPTPSSECLGKALTQTLQEDSQICDLLESFLIQPMVLDSWNLHALSVIAQGRKYATTYPIIRASFENPDKILMPEGDDN